MSNFTSMNTCVKGHLTLLTHFASTLKHWVGQLRSEKNNLNVKGVSRDNDLDITWYDYSNAFATWQNQVTGQMHCQ